MAKYVSNAINVEDLMRKRGIYKMGAVKTNRRVKALNQSGYTDDKFGRTEKFWREERKNVDFMRYISPKTFGEVNNRRKMVGLPLMRREITPDQIHINADMTCLCPINRQQDRWRGSFST